MTTVAANRQLKVFSFYFVWNSLVQDYITSLYANTQHLTSDLEAQKAGKAKIYVT